MLPVQELLLCRICAKSEIGQNTLIMFFYFLSYLLLLRVSMPALQYKEGVDSLMEQAQIVGQAADAGYGLKA